MTPSCLLLLAAVFACPGGSFDINSSNGVRRIATTKRGGSILLMAAGGPKSGSRMPQFSPEELEMINSLSSSNVRNPKPVAATEAASAASRSGSTLDKDGSDGGPRAKKVIRFPVKRKAVTTSDAIAPNAIASLPPSLTLSRKQAIQATEDSKRSLAGDWKGELNKAQSSIDIRNAMAQASYSLSEPSVSSSSSWRPPTKAATEDSLDFDYDDFESAMDELDNGGFGRDKGVNSFKVSVESAAWQGREIGDTIAADVWSALRDSDGTSFRYSRLHKEVASIAVVYVDPRRTTDEFKQMIEAFNKIPIGPMGIAVAVVNIDDSNEHRKLLKKNPSIKMPVLSDLTKTLVDALKCRGPKRLESVLFMLDVKSTSIVNVWYEADIDAATTKDLVVDEIKKYRQNPSEYIKTNKSLK